MARPRRKSPDELMQEAIWSLYDICRLFRKGPKTIMRYINHPDPKKRLPGFMINGEFCAEKGAVLRYFAYKPFSDSGDKHEVKVERNVGRSEELDRTAVRPAR